MGILFDYFAAPSDDDAAATIDWPGGPGQPLPAPSKGLLGGRFRMPQPVVAQTVAYPTVADTGIDPVVQGGTLEELLTGRPYEQVEQDPRWGASLAVRDGGEGLVQTVTDGLVEALARSSAEQLTAVANPWSQTDEFWGAGDPEVLTPLLIELGELARDARSRGWSVYCWTSL